MKTVLVTGCNRGIGLSIIKNLLKLPCPPEKIIATCRDGNKATELAELKKKSAALQIIEIDLSHFHHYEVFIKQVSDIVQENGLNLLINNAGISTKFSRLHLVKVEKMMENFVVNTAVPVMLTKSCLPLLKKASQKYKKQPMGVHRSAVINISSILGSIGANVEGGFYAYRCSKAALNAATKSMSIDLRDDCILVVAMHPGWVKTDMGGKNAPLEADIATATLLQTIQELTVNENGALLQYDGKILPF